MAGSAGRAERVVDAHSGRAQLVVTSSTIAIGSPRLAACWRAGPYAAFSASLMKLEATTTIVALLMSVVGVQRGGLPVVETVNMKQSAEIVLVWSLQ